MTLYAKVPSQTILGRVLALCTLGPIGRPTHVMPDHARLEVLSLPVLNLSALCHLSVPEEHAPLTLVLGVAVVYALVGSGPSSVAVLNQVLAFESPATEQPCNPVWTSLDGQVIHHWPDIRGVVALHFLPNDVDWPRPAFPPAMICEAQVLSHAQPVHLRLQPPGPCQYQLSFPCLTFQALGWQVNATAPVRNTRDPFPSVLLTLLSVHELTSFACQRSTSSISAPSSW